jgi:acyl-CoA hydrolase
VDFVAEGFQDKIMAYSIFSSEGVRDAANEGRAFYLPVTLANIHTMIEKGRAFKPDITLFKIRRNALTDEISMGLSVEALHTAIEAADLVIAEEDPTMPFTHGQSLIDAQTIDHIIVDDVKGCYDLSSPDYEQLSARDKRIGELIARHFIRDGVTLQVGIGKIPDAVVSVLKEATFRDLGVQTELYGDGLMQLQQLGIVTNRKKKVNKGYSTTSLILGSKELYEYAHLRSSLQMRPCAFTNGAEAIRANAPFISINTAMGVDLYGNVWADFIDARRYYSGVGGQPDFIRALNSPDFGVPIITIRSVTAKGESKIIPHHPAGVSLTASSYDPIVVVTEYGIADLRELTVGEKAIALAHIAHPDVRDKYLQKIHDDPYFTKPHDYSVYKMPDGVIEYKGDIKLD